jgi:lysozyme
MDRKPIFDVVRRLLGRGFRQAEIVALDAAIDAAEQPPRVSSHDSVTGVTGPRASVSAEGLELIKQFEGLARLRGDGMVEAYPDPGTGGDPWTIGWGATGPGIVKGTVWTREQCDARLAQDIARYAREVAAAIGDAPTTQAQFDALVSFHYNTGAIARATLTRRHRAGDLAGAAEEFARWNRAGGRVMPGLARRRAAEARLYSS